jgi:Mg-chelatase subunit ChlI
MPNINMPILVLRGEKGSAKTTCFRVIKALVDPSTKFQSATISSPKDIDNLQLQLTE